MAPLEARHLIIHGRVQGVSFRYSMAFEAARLKLAGWVRNRHEGSVEAVITGDAESIATMLAWARHGPPGARVMHVAVELSDLSGSIDGSAPIHSGNFEVKPDA